MAEGRSRDRSSENVISSSPSPSRTRSWSVSDLSSMDLSRPVDLFALSSLNFTKKCDQVAELKGLKDESTIITKALDGKTLESLNISDLKTELGKRKLPKSGLKSVLVERLRTHILDYEISRQNSNYQPPQIDLDSTVESKADAGNKQETEPEELTSTNYVSLKKFNDLERDVLELKDLYKSFQSAQRLKDENGYLREELRLIKSDMDKIREERDSLKLVVSMLSKDLYKNHPDNKPSSQDQVLDLNCDTLPSQSKDGALETETKESNPAAENKRSNQKNANAKRSHKKSNKSTAVNGAKQSGSVQQEHRKPSEVVIAGDSMIKYINGWNLSNASQRVNVKSFSGARVSDMADYIKPLIRKKPESIVLHIGTNDLRDSEPHNVADGVVDLAHQIESADISVAVSGLITRSDSEELTGRVKETNRLLRSFCNQNGWEFVPNTNITSAHLNTKGLHLIKSGTQVLVRPGSMTLIQTMN
ncbi:uncharacterized protein LOC116603374 isoform X2 [Nematostella vectensis]|uniref:uncharacterized protein LOC116603374 isoform X2 n=1 Tax=Nematostella vectensis TaxID=45351 RepID=UPI00207790DA|nr:uncharacterized protein LOC116603374 isoform X2 [Nematostella vectensis]